MHCPVCKLDNNSVLRTRQGEDDVITRVRLCACGNRFVTYEASGEELRRLKALERTLLELRVQLFDNR